VAISQSSFFISTLNNLNIKEMAKEVVIAKIRPKGVMILIRVEIEDFSVFQLSGKGDLKGSSSTFFIEAAEDSIKFPIGNQVLLSHDIQSRCGGFLTGIDNSKGFTSVSEMYKELEQKDREIYNKKSRVNLTEYILITIHDVLAIIDK